MFDVPPNFAMKDFWTFGTCSHVAASFEFNWYNMLPLLSFFAPMKVVCCSLSSSSHPMRSSAVLAFVTKSFSVRLLSALSVVL